ncbi:Hypothetical Protein FCC1311_031002 [Hondaea fermentalgiana]|uniref:Translocation protein SEC66 n=1 Tax=Hondaea fermentalgiana TaxID=2315210 RepID=A0A2R5GAX8_9STRA|nr:Hypothetical Protein FCC1311_031002 [Hondaea fermentalgiana]|eukprot:GBG26878.1 Hypothetical Protein FCC1311_031002 [Hondaea fermentalgiana]
MASEGGPTGEEESQVPPVEEVLTAQQALVLVVVLLLTALFYAYRWYRRGANDRAANAFMDYDFELPKEKHMFMEIYKQKPENKRENAAKLQEWRKALMQVHFKRVLGVISLHEKVMADYRTQTALYKRGVAVSMLPQVEAAKKLVEREVQECGGIANNLQEGWGRTIFQEAYQMKEKLDANEAAKRAKEDQDAREKREAELLRQAKELQEKEEEMLRKRAEEDLLGSKEAN